MLASKSALLSVKGRGQEDQWGSSSNVSSLTLRVCACMSHTPGHGKELHLVPASDGVHREGVQEHVVDLSIGKRLGPELQEQLQHAGVHLSANARVVGTRKSAGKAPPGSVAAPDFSRASRTGASPHQPSQWRQWRRSLGTKHDPCVHPRYPSNVVVGEFLELKGFFKHPRVSMLPSHRCRPHSGPALWAARLAKRS